MSCSMNKQTKKDNYDTSRRNISVESCINLYGSINKSHENPANPDILHLIQFKSFCASKKQPKLDKKAGRRLR